MVWAVSRSGYPFQMSSTILLSPSRARLVCPMAAAYELPKTPHPLGF